MPDRTRLYIILGFITIIISSYFRFLPYSSRVESGFNHAAEIITVENLKSGLEKHIAGTYPDATPAEKIKMLNSGMADVLTTKKNVLKQTVKNTVKKLKSSGYPGEKRFFLIEADSYYYLGLIKNILETGRISPVIKGGLYYNTLMMAPLGNMYYFDLHPYIGLMTYKIMSFFTPSLPLETAAAHTSIFLAALAVALFMFFAYSAGAGPIPAFTASVFFSSAPIFLQRSLYGWFDTDTYNVLFPLAIIFFFFKICGRGLSLRSVLSNIFAASLVTAFYTMFWSGWIYAFLTSIIFLLAAVISSVFMKDKKFTFTLAKGVLFYAVSSSLIIIMLRAFDGFVFSFTDTFSRAGHFAKDSFSLWPDSFIMVGELKHISLAKLAVLSGGRIFGIMALAGLLYISFCKKISAEKTYQALLKGLLLFIFILVPFIMSKKAERFTILLVPPLSIAFLLSIDYFYKDFLKGIKDISSKHFFSGAVVLMAILPLVSSYAICMRKQPVIYNEAWDKSMEYIKANTPPESIINTWWPPGHFITGMARRGVLFDGATLEKPVGYWISRFFMSTDENEARGILRMLDSSGNKAAEFLTDKGYSLSKAAALINKVLPLNKEQAKVALFNSMREDALDKLLSFTHGTPRPGYVFIYNDLAEKVIAMEFMGFWDFRKAELFGQKKKNDPAEAEKFMKDNFNGNYVKLLWSISGGQLYCEDESPEIKRDGSIVYFKNGLIFETRTGTIGYTDKAGKFKGVIGQIMYAEGKEIKTKSIGQGKLTLVIVERGNKYAIIVADRRIASSMLFRLYYFDGYGLDYFELVNSTSSKEDNTRIKLFEVKY